MKILFCTNTFEGAGNGPTRFANYLLEINENYPDVELRILTEDVDPSRLGAYRGKVVPLDIRWSVFTRSWGFVYRMYPYYRACRALRSEFPYDVVVFNNAITGIWSARRLKVPVLGMLNDYTNLSVSWRDFDGSWRWFRRFLFRFLEERACRVGQGVIVNSNYLLRRVVEVYGPPPEKVKLLYKGVDLAHKLPPAREESGAVKVLFVKADFRLGGLFDLMEALNLCPGFGFELYVVGPAERFRDEIVNRPVRPHVRVVFAGPVPGREVYDYMARCHLFVLPSYREALGVANMEALFYKLPVITSNVGGIPEVMDGGNNGWLVRPGQPEELSRMVRYVLENPAEAARKQRNGYEFVRRHFSIKSTLERFVSLARAFA